MGKTATVPASDPAQVGPQWVDKFGRVRTPRAYYEHGDGKTVVGPQAIVAMNEAWEAGEFCGLQRDVGRTQPRARGAGRPKVRGASRRSSARSGDSGDSEDSEGSEPPERLCACCGADISHRAPQARYLNDAHAAADRQRRLRNRSRDWSADVSRADPYLRFDDKRPFADILRRVEQGCRCNGHHIRDGGGCFKCGHQLADQPRGERVFIRAGSAETRRPRKAGYELFA